MLCIKKRQNKIETSRIFKILEILFLFLGHFREQEGLKVERYGRDNPPKAPVAPG